MHQRLPSLVAAVLSASEGDCWNYWSWSSFTALELKTMKYTPHCCSMIWCRCFYCFCHLLCCQMNYCSCFFYFVVFVCEEMHSSFLFYTSHFPNAYTLVCASIYIFCWNSFHDSNGQSSHLQGGHRDKWGPLYRSLCSKNYTALRLLNCHCFSCTFLIPAPYNLVET